MAVVRRKTARRKKRPPQWNEERRRIFLETLAQMSNVAASEREAGMPAGSAYRERRRSPEFLAKWMEALDEGYNRLEMTLLERAISGIAKRTTKTGEGQVVEEFSDRLGMGLLTAHRAMVMEARGKAALIDAETAKERLARKLAEMCRRVRDED